MSSSSSSSSLSSSPSQIIYNLIYEQDNDNEFFYYFSIIMVLVFLSVSFIFTFKSTRRGTYIACLMTKRNTNIINRISKNVGDYIPPTWYSADIGTCVAFGYDIKIKYEREIIHNDDAMFAVDWYPYKPIIHDHHNIEQQQQQQSMNSNKIIIFLPGLGLHSGNKFCQQFVSTAYERSGYITAVLNSRGSNIPLKSKKVWYPGLHDDTLLLLKHLEINYPSSKLFLVGYSAGSNLVIRTISEKSKPLALKAAMCVCVNRDYLSARNNLENSFRGCVYSFLMTMAYKDVLKKNSHIHHEIGEEIVTKLLNCHFLSDYDRVAATNLYGFNSQTEYFKTVSTHSTNGIDIPLLALQPFDDPLHLGRVREHVQVDDFIKNDNIIYYEPEYGNHFGFYEGTLWNMFSNTTSYTYPAKLAVEFFNTIIDEK